MKNKCFLFFFSGSCLTYPFPVPSCTCLLLDACNILRDLITFVHKLLVSCGLKPHIRIRHVLLFRFLFALSAAKITVIQPNFIQVYSKWINSGNLIAVKGFEGYELSWGNQHVSGNRCFLNMVPIVLYKKSTNIGIFWEIPAAFYAICRRDEGFGVCSSAVHRFVFRMIPLWTFSVIVSG